MRLYISLHTVDYPNISLFYFSLLCAFLLKNCCNCSFLIQMDTYYKIVCLQSLRSLNAFVGRSLSTLLKNKILRKRTAKKRKSGDALMKLTLDPTATKEGLLRITDGANQSDIHTRAMVVKEGLLRITDGASESDDLVKKKVYHTNQKWLPPKRIFNLKKMDEAEIVTSLPCVLDTLHIHSLQSILTVLTGFATRILNRSWLEERIVQTVNEYVDGCGDTLPDVVTQAMEIMRDERAARKPMSSGNLYELPSSSILAVQSALDQVESLPLRTLHAMYDLMHEKPVQNVRLDESATGGNRARLARALRKGAEILTWDLKDDDPLPEPLTRALRAMSLSAKELDGSDGNLLSIIGPPPPDVEAVHNKLLSALSQLKKLEFHRLTSLSSLVHEGPVQSFCKDHPTYLRSHFRRILLDFLLRCDDPEVPAPIQNIIDAIAAEDTQLSVSPEKSKKYEKKPKKPDRVSKRSMWQQGERNSEEVEAVLQIGSHLEQIVREKEEVERKIVIVPVNVEEDCEQCGVESTVSRNEDEEDLIEDVAVRTAADEAGALCYTILGRALEELLPPKASPLPHYVQKYLKGGFHRVAKQGTPHHLQILFSFTTHGLHKISGKFMHLAWWALHDFVLYIAGEAVDRNEKTGDEVDLLMKIAESLPGVSTRFGFLSVILIFKF